MIPALPDADCALFFDFDGTLVNLAARPDEIQVHADVPRLLARLEQALGGAVAVVSGRPLAQVDQHLRPLKLCVAGVHGTERRGADGRVVHLAVRGLDEASALVQGVCERHPALRLEMKPGGMALHYRQAPELEDLCLATMGQALALAEDMTLLRGKMVVELKPRRAGKGLAIRSFLDEAPFRQRRPWFFGDDVADEAGFEVVQGLGGVAVKVGAGETLAAHHLADPDAVRHWLAAATELPLQPARNGAAR